MAVNHELLESTKGTSEYQNGVSILGDPDDYASQTMLQFIGFFYMMTIQKEGNIEGMEGFIRDLGITPTRNGEMLRMQYEDEEALMTAFTYIVGRGTKEFFDSVLKLLHEQTGQ